MQGIPKTSHATTKGSKDYVRWKRHQSIWLITFEDHITNVSVEGPPEISNQGGRLLSYLCKFPESMEVKDS